MATAAYTQENQLFYTQFHQVLSLGGRYDLRSPLTFKHHLPDLASPRNWTSSLRALEFSML
jgi:hypothetical protein